MISAETPSELERIVLDITDLTPSGDAVGRHEGMVVFVPLVLPGERVEVEIIHKRKHFWRGRAVQWMTRRLDRVEPPCKYFGRCGGCQLQHLSYRTQLAMKTGFVREQFAHIGKFDSAPVMECVAAPAALGYRNRVQFSIGETGKPGFHPPRQHGVLDIDECLIADSYINQQLKDLISSAVTIEANQIDLRAPMQPVRVDDFDYFVSPQSFFQVNTAQAANMVRHAVAQLKLTNADHALDLYCGVGLFTLPMAHQAGYVVGLEVGESSTNDARRNLKGLIEDERARIITADVGKALGRSDIASHGWQAVLLDPPRAGMTYETMKLLSGLRAKRLVYVSCDPATLARDARLLCDSGYELEVVQPFDMFAQTNHVESVATFVRS